jgi:hypothetical protein
MRKLVSAIVTASLLAILPARAENTPPLAPGHPAGVKKADLLDGALFFPALLGAAIIAGIVIAVTDNSGGGGGSSSSSTSGTAG